MEGVKTMLTRFDPFREMTSLRSALDRFLEEGLPGRTGFLSVEPMDIGVMPIDIYEEGHTIVLKASIPGFKPDDIKVSVREDTVSIIAETRADDEKKDRNYHLREHRYSRLERAVALPTNVVADKADAVFQNGVLTLSMPRAEATRTKEVKVKVKA
jgi:HSP20 family protein